jgi:hypothetical protein
MGKKRGRPPKAPEARQAGVLQIGLTADELELIEKAAGDEKPVAWARTALVRAAKRRLK